MDDDKIPQAIATREIEVLGHKITVHVLDDGRRVIDARDMEKFVDILSASVPER